MKFQRILKTLWKMEHFLRFRSKCSILHNVFNDNISRIFKILL